MGLTKAGVTTAKKESGAARSARDMSWTLSQLNGARAMVLIGLLAVLAYANSLGGDFVFDDTDQVVDNQNTPSGDTPAKAFTTHVWAFRGRAAAGSPPEGLDVPPPLP